MGVTPMRASMAGSSSKESCSSWATFTDYSSLPDYSSLISNMKATVPTSGKCCADKTLSIYQKCCVCCWFPSLFGTKSATLWKTVAQILSPRQEVQHLVYKYIGQVLQALQDQGTWKMVKWWAKWAGGNHKSFIHGIKTGNIHENSLIGIILGQWHCRESSFALRFFFFN